MPATTEAPETKIKDALDHARTAAQELHAALSDAAAKHGGALRADIEAIPLMSKAIVESLKNSLGLQNESTRKSVAEAVTFLEATGTHAAEALRSSGEDAVNSIQRAIADARASAQKISEAVAEKRAAAGARAAKTSA
jgi:hypothetical protein